MLRFFQLMAMGLGPMPHVGSHPGLPVLMAFVATAVVACLPKGLEIALLAGPAMLLALGPFVLYSAFDRARRSLHWTRLEAKALLQAYTDLHFKPGLSIQWTLVPVDDGWTSGWKHQGPKLDLFVQTHAASPQEPAPEYLRSLVERALSPHGFFAVPVSLVACTATPFPSAHARLHAIKQVSGNEPQT